MKISRLCFGMSPKPKPVCHFTFIECAIIVKLNHISATQEYPEFHTVNKNLITKFQNGEIGTANWIAAEIANQLRKLKISEALRMS